MPITRSLTRKHTARTKVRTLRKWGYVSQKHLFQTSELRIHYRPSTTDEKVIDEVLSRHTYQNKTAGVAVEKEDCWLDLGGNIGTFALFVLSLGAAVISVEPEPENVRLLTQNIMDNFPTSPYKIMDSGVGLKDTSMSLYLCKGAYNKYRHSMFLNKGRSSIPVKVHSFLNLLNQTVSNSQRTYSINAIKMDIEGMEIPILEQFTTAKNYKNINKLVFEYTFDVDPSIPRFMRIIRKLKKVFRTVHFTRVNPTEQWYTYFPPCATVYCVK